MNWSNIAKYIYHTELTGGAINRTIRHTSGGVIHRYRLQVYLSENSVSHHQYVFDSEKEVLDDDLRQLFVTFKCRCEDMDRLVRELVG